MGTPLSQCSALSLRQPRRFGVRGRERFALARREPGQRFAVDAGSPRVVHGEAYLRAFRAGLDLGFGALRGGFAGALARLLDRLRRLGLFNLGCIRLRVGLGVGLGFRLGLGLGLFLVGAREVALVFLVRL